MATFQLFNSINNYPPNFGTAAAIGVLLILCALIPIFVQSRALKSRSYATLSGRTVRPKMVNFKGPAKILGTVFLIVVFLLGIAIPIFGAVVASMLPSFGNGNSLKLNFTFANYDHLFKGNYISPVFLSFKLSFVAAGITVILGVIMARLLVSKRQSKMSKGVDLALLGSMALPGVVLAAGYIFSFNLPIASKLGIDLYETIPLLVMGYIATALPSQARLLVAPISQFKDSMIESSKAHGNGNIMSWYKIGFPLMSKTLMWAWVLTFVKTFTELPVSQILYPPGQEPISVAISDLLSGYHYDLATALTVTSLGEVLLFIVIVTAMYSLLVPKGWRRIGNAVRAN
jgi:iron(III) transport system permease protein